MTTTRWNPSDPEARAARRARAAALPQGVKMVALTKHQAERRSPIEAELRATNLAQVLRTRFGCDVADDEDYHVTVTLVGPDRHRISITARDHDGEVQRFEVRFGPRGGRTLHRVKATR